MPSKDFWFSSQENPWGEDKSPGSPPFRQNRFLEVIISRVVWLVNSYKQIV